MNRRPHRPTETTITLGLHTVKFTFCTICHAIVKVETISGMDMQTRQGMDLIEDMHYDWHERTGTYKKD